MMMKKIFLLLLLACLLATPALPQASAADAHTRSWHVGLGISAKALQYTGETWKLMRETEIYSSDGTNYTRVPLPSPVLDFRLRLDLGRHLFLSQDFSAGCWLFNTTGKTLGSTSGGTFESIDSQLEYMAMATVALGVGTRLGKNQVSGHFAGNLFGFGGQRTHFKVDRPGTVQDFDQRFTTKIITDNYYAWDPSTTYNVFSDYEYLFGMNRIVWSASLRYAREMRLMKSPVSLWASLEGGLNPVFRDHDPYPSVFPYSWPGMYFGFRAVNLGIIATLF